MAEGEGGGGGKSADVIFIMLIIVFLIAAWFISGGYKRANTKSLFLAPPAPSMAVSSISSPSVGIEGGFDYVSDPLRDDAMQTSSEVALVKQELERLKGFPVSSYSGQIEIRTSSGGFETNPAREYVTLRVRDDATRQIDITGWRLQSAVSGRTAFIRNGTAVYSSGEAVGQEHIVLNPGDSAIVSSGRSPVGTSFRENICTGYLSQFQEFTPDLEPNCPYPEAEAEDTNDDTIFANNTCYSYLQGMRQCTVELNPPSTLPPNCRAFISNTLTYQGCVKAHRYESDFKSRQWRVYLGYSEDLWRSKREVLTLLDSEGKLVDSSTY